LFDRTSSGKKKRARPEAVPFWSLEQREKLMAKDKASLGALATTVSASRLGQAGALIVTKM
jgi:hypothetical protein